MTTAFADRLCSVVAAGLEQDPICTAGSTPRLMAMEVPLPWGENLSVADVEGTVLQQIYAVRKAWLDDLRAQENWQDRLVPGIPQLYGIQPDREWSSPESRRVLLAIRPEGRFADYEMSEYSFPQASAVLVDFARAFFNAPEELGGFEAFRVPHVGHREFFVCTHGHVDICCAKFGIPLYQQARAAYPLVRAWRMTHFGGHRFAPTAWEYPAAYKWAFLDEDAACRVLQRDGEGADLAPKLRGWSGVPNQVQILDREGLKHYGWRWLAFRRSGEIIEADTEGRRWRVRLEFESPEGEAGVYEGTVIVGRELHEVGCGPHAGDYDFQVPEYALEAFTQHPGRGP